MTIDLRDALLVLTLFLHLPIIGKLIAQSFGIFAIFVISNITISEKQPKSIKRNQLPPAAIAPVMAAFCILSDHKIDCW